MADSSPRHASHAEIEAFVNSIAYASPYKDDCWVCNSQGFVVAPSGRSIRCGECGGRVADRYLPLTIEELDGYDRSRRDLFRRLLASALAR